MSYFAGKHQFSTTNHNCPNVRVQSAKSERNETRSCRCSRCRCRCRCRSSRSQQEAQEAVVMCAGQKAKRMCAQSTLSASRRPSNLSPPPFPIPLSPLCCIHSRACMLCPCTVHKHAVSKGDAASRRRRQRSARERERAHVTSLYIKWRCIWAADVCSCVRVHL